MLYFLVMPDNRSPLRRYFREWGAILHGRVRLLSYPRIGDASRLPNGAYVFCDIERLPPDGVEHAALIWDSLEARGDRVRLLNSPHRLVRRRELLRALHTTGSNRFNVYGLDDPREGIRYPVFLRSERNHSGPLTPFLNSDAEVCRAIDKLVAEGHPRWDILIVEFLDTAVDGLYRKYSVTRVGATLLAQHVFFSKEWVVKAITDWPPDFVRIDNEFLRDNPHAAQLAEIFDLAHIDFGRADYAMLDGEVQLWEINTNPTFFMHRHRYGADRLGPKLDVSNRINAALVALDPSPREPGLLERVASYKDLHW